MKIIAIIDDDPGIQEAIRFIFPSGKYIVKVYSSGTGVLDNEYPVADLYILDKQLSGVDGLDICRYLKSQENSMHVPVIMLSASPDIGRLAGIAGADAAIEKPFELKTLRRSVESLLND